ncbi:MAG: D-xylose transport system permease protein [Thermoleophilaceae bacterium]|jgi:D-xylose transport system permease protein|nr:D-xylose transport system permease protein [Thermoleophilaceae bacterium]
MSTAEAAPTAQAPQDGDAAQERPGMLKRVLQGDLASLRVVIGLIVIWTIFQTQNDRFLSAINLTNLGLQITGIGLISVGIVYVLLLGEIDLSVGAVSGLAAAVMAVENVKHGWNPYLSIAVGIAVGVAIGMVQGWLFARFGVPSFVVTLAGLLAYQGALLYVLGDTGTVNLTDPKIVGLANTFYGDATGWILAVVVIAAFAGLSLWGYRKRVAAGLTDQDLVPILVKIAVVTVATLAAISVFNSDRGLPLAVLILIGFVVVMQYVVTRTTFGRHVFAVGGNAEAARRAGIKVNRIRIIVFGIAGGMAAIGGIMLASRLLAVNQSSGGSDLLLLAIAGPVIAGTSLFGGRGSVWSALLGALVIGSISNGMDLLAYSSDIKFMVTGAVLLGAVLIDSIARNQRAASGRI